MKIAAFQFHGSGNIEANYEAILRGIEAAKQVGVRFFLTQECALTGYPPIEVASVEQIDFKLVKAKMESFAEIARQNRMYVCIGTVLPKGDRHTNSVCVFSPEPEETRQYDKRALWGWDVDNYFPGETNGIYEIDGVKIGIRICYEVRFPELFRELYLAGASICFVSFCDNKDEFDPDRFELLKNTLRSRAIENVCYIVTANTTSQQQTVPTMIVDSGGNILQMADRGKEVLLVQDINAVEENFGTRGIRTNNNRILSL